MFLLPATPFQSVFEGDDTQPEATPRPQVVAFSSEQQAKVNSLLADERRREQTKREQVASQLDAEKARSEKLATESQSWKGKYVEKVKNDALSAAAAAAKAASPKLVVDLLSTLSRVDEVTDADGNPTGDFLAVVQLGDTDMSPAEAMQQLKTSPDYAGLFLSPVQGGLGGTNLGRGATGGSKPMHELSTEEYIRERNKRLGRR